MTISGDPKILKRGEDNLSIISPVLTYRKRTQRSIGLLYTEKAAFWREKIEPKWVRPPPPPLNLPLVTIRDFAAMHLVAVRCAFVSDKLKPFRAEFRPTFRSSPNSSSDKFCRTSSVDSAAAAVQMTANQKRAEDPPPAGAPMTATVALL